MINEEIVTKVPEVFREGAYSLNVVGKIYREQEHIATRDRETQEVTFLEGKSNFKQSVARFLNKADADREAAGASIVAKIESEIAAEAEAGEPIAPETPEPVVEERELSLTEIMGDYPQGAPATDWRGDLTPAFLAWYFEHYPERAKLRYAQRGLVPVVHEFLSKLSNN